MRVGAEVEIRKFTYPPQATRDSDPIEYWPCCGMWDKGEPNRGKETFVSANDPTELGLIWINAPETGQPCGGANCGGEKSGGEVGKQNYYNQQQTRQATPSFPGVEIELGKREGGGAGGGG